MGIAVSDGGGGVSDPRRNADTRSVMQSEYALAQREGRGIWEVVVDGACEKKKYRKTTHLEEMKRNVLRKNAMTSIWLLVVVVKEGGRRRCRALTR
jgi:hypothetical protein